MSTKKYLAVAAVAMIVVTFPLASQGAKKGGFKTTGITLYDCGLGQVEKQASVVGEQELSIGVSQAHLDDLLASMMLVTDDSVTVREINYPSVRNLGQAISSSSVAEAMRDGGSGVTIPSSVPGYLEALVGLKVRVERKGRGLQEGTVLACVNREHPEEVFDLDGGNGKAKKTPSRTLVLVGKDGSISWIPVDDIGSIVPVSKREATALSDFATQLGKANGFTDLEVTLSTGKRSRGKLAAAYIRQMPLWKTAYKVTATDEGVVLEVWAVVHNDTSEDWNDVEMTLVSGLPKSYVFSMASPRYVQRETLVLEGEGEMMPQLGAAAPDSLLYDFEGIMVSEAYGYGGLGLSGRGSGGGGGYGRGMGALSGRAGRSVTYGMASEQTSSLLNVGEPAAQEGAVARVEGEISTYRAMNKVTIPAGTSSMVPLVRRKLSGGAFTLLENGNSPSTCVRVENETGLVLQGGMASFYISGRFRGQSELYRTEPEEVGLWCFGEDPDLEFSVRNEVENNHELLEWRGEALWSHNRKRTSHIFSIENKAGQQRKVALEVRHIQNGRVISPKKVVSTEVDGQRLYLTSVSRRSEVEKTVLVEEGVMTRIELNPDALHRMAKVESIPVEQRRVLQSARAFLVKEEQLKKRLQQEKGKEAKAEAKVEETRKTMADLPSGGGHSDALEGVLTRLVSAQNAQVDHQKKAKALELRIEGTRKAAIELLKRLERKDED